MHGLKACDNVSGLKPQMRFKPLFKRFQPGLRCEWINTHSKTQTGLVRNSVENLTVKNPTEFYISVFRRFSGHFSRFTP